MSTGGVQVEGLGATDIDGQGEFQNSPSVGDFGLELHRRISAVYGRSERLETVLKNGIKDPSVWRFESRVAESVIKDWLGEFPNIQIIKVWRFKAAESADDQFLTYIGITCNRESCPQERGQSNQSIAVKWISCCGKSQYDSTVEVHH